MEKGAKERSRLGFQGLNTWVNDFRGMVVFQHIVEVLEVLDEVYGLCQPPTWVP